MPKSVQKHLDTRILRHGGAIALILVPLILFSYLGSSLTTLISTVVILLIVWFLFAYLRFSVSRANLKTFAKALRSEVKRPFLGLPFYFVVEGRWQERNVRLKLFTSVLHAMDSSDIGISIEPKFIAEEAKNVALWLMTELTTISGQRIYYAPSEAHPLSGAKFNTRRFSDEEVLSILNELTRAAENVETGKHLEFSCPSCHTIIHKEEEQCSKCGWTWK